jgi:hypothetical protein
MLSFSGRRHVSSDPPRSISARDSFAHAHQLRIPWINFNICPHCVTNRRRALIEWQSEWGPIISRSDALNFHLILNDRPFALPWKRAADRTGMIVVAFCYVHEANRGLTDNVTVILRKPPRGGVRLLQQLETVADKLADELWKSSSLRSLYEFDGRGVRQVPPLPNSTAWTGVQDKSIVPSLTRSTRQTAHVQQLGHQGKEITLW